MLLTLSPDITVMDAVRAAVDSGWALAVVPHAEPRLITSRTVIRSLLNSNSTTSIQDAADRVGPIALPVSWNPETKEPASTRPHRTRRA